MRFVVRRASDYERTWEVEFQSIAQLINWMDEFAKNKIIIRRFEGDLSIIIYDDYLE